MLHTYVKNNATTAAILLFMAFYFGLMSTKPAWLYHTDGSLRQFGVGYKESTILPIWLLAVLAGILSYMAVLTWVAASSR